jgi:hypothetical protein
MDDSETLPPSKFFPIAKWRIFILLAFCIGFEYMSIEILLTPYEILDARSDKYHPIFGYIFFGVMSPILAVLIMVYTLFIFRAGRGIYLTTNGLIDRTTPFAVLEIPFDRILQICNATNKVTRIRGFKIRENQISIHLRGRKVDNVWIENLTKKGIGGKLLKWKMQLGIYSINTKILKSSHAEVIAALEEHIKLEPRIKMYAMDAEQTFKDLKKKRKEEKRLAKK